MTAARIGPNAAVPLRLPLPNLTRSPEMQKPVAIVDEENPVNGRFEVIARFNSVQDAEEFLATSATIDPDQLARGGYGIDAPEWMVNP